MLNTDRDALECDLAETYHIYDMYELPLSKVALFSYGLRSNSRIKMKLNDSLMSFQDMLIASCVDRLSVLAWQNTEDGRKGINTPKSIFDIVGLKKDSKYMTFESLEDFEKERERILMERREQ